MNIIHKRTKFTKEHMYIKNVLSQVMTMHADGNFKELAETYNEISAIAAYLCSMAADNHHQVEDSMCKGYSI